MTSKRLPDIDFLTISFLGAGRWAQSLSLLFAQKAKRVTLWEGKEREPKRAKGIPPGILFPKNVAFTTSLPLAFEDSQIIVFSLPSSALREVLEKVQFFVPKESILISTIKGIDEKTLKFPSQMIREYLPDNEIFVLAGPGIPYEVACGKPTSLVLAGEDLALGRELQKSLSQDNLCFYLGQDILGVEIGGALKNVIAIASGIVDGKGWGINAKANLLTRGLKEMVMVATALGGKAETLYGLAGIGDLILTGFSPHSRNYQLGLEIGRGKSPEEVLTKTNGVVEGHHTAKVIPSLKKRFNFEIPIMVEVHRVLFLGEDPEISLKRLLARELKEE